MKNINDILREIGSGEYDEILYRIYRTSGLAAHRSRLIKALNDFENEFGVDREVSIFSAPARTEISGNHTDHQFGNVLSAAVNMDTIGICSLNNDGVIRVKSEGYPLVEIAVSMSMKKDPNEYSPLGEFVISDLDPYPNEAYTPTSLVRGIAAKYYLMGKELRGFDCYVTSSIIQGMGLSSSAAYEMVIANIMNTLYMDGFVSPDEVAEIAHFAEYYYFKKSCGLMGQLTSSLGGMLWLDFYDTDTPFVTKIDFDFKKMGYTICIIDSGASTKGLEREFEMIPREMKSVANFFGKPALSRVSEEEFVAYIGDVRKACGDRAVLRAWHFFEEDKRAVNCAKFLQKYDVDGFLSEIRKSGNSSAMYLQNLFSTQTPQSQSITVALACCEKLLGNRGAYRVHGGGFGGTVQAFVPDEMVVNFKKDIEKMLGKNCCHIIKIRQCGTVKIGGKYA